MENIFIQKKVGLNAEKSSGMLKVEKLCNLITEHPHKDAIYEAFEIEKIKDEIICIDFIDTLFEKIHYYNTKYNRYSICAETKDIDVYQKIEVVDGKNQKDIIFKFEEYIDGDEVKNDLSAIAIYNSKNTFLDEYDMTKYANNLFKIGESGLANYNVQHFKTKAKFQKEYNKLRSYRLVEYDNQLYLRGITSATKYNEYGVDFSFVVSMLILHSNMKLNKGIEYMIKSAYINESKLEIIVSEKLLKDAGSFGKVSTAINISTNDLGQGSLIFFNILSVGQLNNKGFFLYPKKNVQENGVLINHITKPEKVFSILKDMDKILNTSDNLIKELEEIKKIKHPDELRMKILTKIINPKSSLSRIKKLSDIFDRKIDNEISSFAKLLEMCNKAEELDMEFDLKDKLRYIISDIILYANKKN